MLFNKTEREKIRKLHDSVMKDTDWDKLFKKNGDDVAYSYETGGYKVPLMYKSGPEEAYQIMYDLGIKDPEKEDLKAFNVAYRKCAKEYRTKHYDSKSVMKDSDALAKLAYEFAQMGNYFDRANSAHSREYLAENDDVKYREFLRKAIQVKSQLQKEVAAMKNQVISAGEISSWENKTKNLLIDGCNRLYWTASDMRDKTGEKLSKEIDALNSEYARIITFGSEKWEKQKRQEYFSKKKDSKVKDDEAWYEDFESLAEAKKWAKKYKINIDARKAPWGGYQVVFEGDRNKLMQLIEELERKIGYELTEYKG